MRPPAPAPANPLAGARRPCGEKSPERADAQKRFDALDAQIKALKPADNHKPANDALIALLEHRCMGLADVATDDFRAEAAPALAEFWNNGGSDWILGYLNLATTDSISFPPTMRAVIAAETRPGHPLFSLLCSLKDPTCGAGTHGWWMRTEQAFEAAGRSVYRGQDTPAASESVCAAEALAKPVGHRLEHWETCAAAIDKTRAAMPLGRVKVPASGWLIVRGRRGHYNYCDEVRIYSLATGAAYISQSCNQLFVVSGDKVRHGTTSDRKAGVKRGTVPLANLRELAWLLVQVDDVVDTYREGYRTYEIPEGVERAKLEDGVSEYHGQISIGSSNQTTLAWGLADTTSSGGAGRPRRGKTTTTRVLASGTLTWPTDYTGGARDHAVDLMRVAEAGFVAGCPRERPPKLRRLGKARPHVSPVDADNDALALLEGDLVEAIDREARRGCKRRR